MSTKTYSDHYPIPSPEVAIRSLATESVSLDRMQVITVEAFSCLLEEHIRHDLNDPDETAALRYTLTTLVKFLDYAKRM